MKAGVALVGAALATATLTAALANGLDQLQSFHATIKSGKVSFRQAVVAKGDRGTKTSTGTFLFERPGKFRWEYKTPYEQLIVGDGEKVWVYDRDLNQVIVRRLDRALGSTPAALLSGEGSLEKNFELTDAGTREGIDYVEAKPRAPDTGFDLVRIGLVSNLPRAMELRDTFGNMTRLTFEGFERNPSLDPSVFKFVPPQGADVVGEK